MHVRAQVSYWLFLPLQTELLKQNWNKKCKQQILIGFQRIRTMATEDDRTKIKRFGMTSAKSRAQ